MHTTPTTTSRTALLALGLLFACTSVYAAREAAPAAATPTADQIVANMREAVAPDETLFARARVATETRDDNIVVYETLVARRTLDDTVRTAIKFSDGSTFEDIAMLWGTRRDNGEMTEAVYLPHENRVREIVPVNPEQKFLRTDFTRADLGLVPRGEHTFDLVGVAEIGNRKTFQIEARPMDSAYFSRIVTWVAADTWLPVQREYYDRAGRLWKIGRYQSLVIDGHPTITSISLDDIQTGSRSNLVIESLRYEEAGHDWLFSPEGLERISDRTPWAGL